MKVAHAAVAASRGDTSPLVVGALDASVDWGYASDFVDAFTKILAEKHAADFVVATGVLHTVRDFAKAAYGHLGLDWSHFVREDPAVLGPRRTGRVGNPAKLRNLTGWQPSLTFVDMVKTLVDAVVGANTAASGTDLPFLSDAGSTR
jgi:GDPmannose 4,6-dehydratase